MSASQNVSWVDNNKQGMNRCHSCRNTRRQLLMLKCSHDTCIKCAADNYFINCKNRPNSKKPTTNTYYCEKCLEQTTLDPNTIETLRKYFMENVATDDHEKNSRRQKLAERRMEQQQRLEKVARLDSESSHRPKSLQIEIAQRKRTLSKYLSQQQVDKFIQMQNEYGRNSNQPTHKAEPQFTPQPHNSNTKATPKAHFLNEYELTRGQAERKKERGSININDSFEKFAEQQRKSANYDYTKNDNPSRMRGAMQEMEYEIYHNGKGVPNPQLKAAERLLQEERNQGKTNSRPSSNSSNKIAGTIRSKRSPNKPELPPAQKQPTGAIIRRQRITSYTSEDNLRHPQKVKTEYNPQLPLSNTQEAWEAESKSTKKEKTLYMPDRNSSDTVEKILDTFEASQQQRTGAQAKQSVLGTRGPPEHEEVYYCKIHLDEEIIYFCLKCSQLVCSQCALHGAHRSHQIHSLKKSAVMLRQRLAQGTATLSKMLIEEEGKEKILLECIHQINVECARQKEQVRSSFENFIFHIDKKYKEILKEVEDRFTSLLTDYSDKLNQSRNNQLQLTKVKESAGNTLQTCAVSEEGSVSETSIGAACNQLGNFHVKRPRARPAAAGIQCINQLTSSIRQLQEFLKSSNALLFSSKKESLLSQNSSLRLSDSSNLLEEVKETPETTTPQGQSLFKRISPDKRKNGASGCSVQVKSRLRVTQCECIVESLLEMQEIVKAIKPEWTEYQLKALPQF